MPHPIDSFVGFALVIPAEIISSFKNKRSSGGKLALHNTKITEFFPSSYLRIQKEVTLISY